MKHHVETVIRPLTLNNKPMVKHHLNQNHCTLRGQVNKSHHEKTISEAKLVMQYQFATDGIETFLQYQLWKRSTYLDESVHIEKQSFE